MAIPEQFTNVGPSGTSVWTEIETKWKEDTIHDSGMNIEPQGKQSMKKKSHEVLEMTIVWSQFYW